MVWAECLFADPVADIAVLGVPDEKYLSSEDAAFEALLESARPLVVANVPAQSRDARGEDAARVLSLDGRVERWGEWLAFSPEKEFFEPGMSGSPIIDETGKARRRLG